MTMYERSQDDVDYSEDLDWEWGKDNWKMVRGLLDGTLLVRAPREEYWDALVMRGENVVAVIELRGRHKKGRLYEFPTLRVPKVKCEKLLECARLGIPTLVIFADEERDVRVAQLEAEDSFAADPGVFRTRSGKLAANPVLLIPVGRFTAIETFTLKLGHVGKLQELPSRYRKEGR